MKIPRKNIIYQNLLISHILWMWEVWGVYRMSSILMEQKREEQRAGRGKKAGRENLKQQGVKKSLPEARTLCFHW